MKFEVYSDAAGDWRWRLKADNGEPIADGAQGYAHKSDCLHGIGLIRERGFAAEVVEVKAES